MTAETPDLTVGSVTGAEDNAISLNIDAALTDTDGSELLSVTISDVPTGAILSAGTDNGDGTWTIDADDFADDPDVLSNLTITPPQDFFGDFNLSVQATSTETASGDEAETAVETFGVTVTPVIDTPELSTSDSIGSEDTKIELQIDADMLPDTTEGVESLIISGIPEGSTLTFGEDSEIIEIIDGTATLSRDQLANLAITPPNDFFGEIDLGVTAISTDGGVAIDTLTVTVEDVADLAVQDATGIEDGTVALDIDPGTASEVTIEGLPANATLSYVDGNGDTQTITTDGAPVTLNASQLNELSVKLDDDESGLFDLTVTTADGQTETLNLTIDADADTLVHHDHP